MHWASYILDSAAAEADGETCRARSFPGKRHNAATRRPAYSSEQR